MLDNDRTNAAFKETIDTLRKHHGYYSDRIEKRFWYFDRKTIKFGQIGANCQDSRDLLNLTLEVDDRHTNVGGYWLPPEGIRQHIKKMVEKELSRLNDVEPERRNENFSKFHSCFDNKLRTKEINDTVRISHLDDGVIRIAKATYLDQVGTNITADEIVESFDEAFSGKSIRRLDSSEAGEIKPFQECLCANTIGVAVISVDKRGNLLFPFREYRSENARSDDVRRRLGAMERGWHCFASGVLEWRDIEESTHRGDIGKFAEGLTAGIKREIFFETGLTPESEGYELIPYAFARELKRPGKPQFFFVARFNDHTNDQLISIINDNLNSGRIREMSEYATAHPSLFSYAHIRRLLGRAGRGERLFWSLEANADAVIADETLRGITATGRNGDGPTYELYGALLLLQSVLNNGGLRWS